MILGNQVHEITNQLVDELINSGTDVSLSFTLSFTVIDNRIIRSIIWVSFTHTQRTHPSKSINDWKKICPPITAFPGKWFYPTLSVEPFELLSVFLNGDEQSLHRWYPHEHIWWSDRKWYWQDDISQTMREIVIHGKYCVWRRVTSFFFSFVWLNRFGSQLIGINWNCRGRNKME
jgi:hypothetical protein